jgi:CheY-like chemotaxis protein
MFRTLLVEDYAPIRRVVRFYLQSEFPSMVITEAANGVEALKEIASHPPDLIFMDIQLREGSGLELTRMIKTDHPGIIVIILTGHDLPEPRKVAAQYKADYFFSKISIPSGEIATLVKSILLEKGVRANGSIEAPELRKEKTMPLIRKRRIWWEPLSEASSYVVYVSKDETVYEPENFAWEATRGIISKVVTGKAEMTVPDEWPEFPAEMGTYHIGITSMDDLGNQSDPIVLSGLFKFSAPQAPSRGGIESL